MGNALEAGFDYVSGLLDIATKIYTTGPEGVQIFSMGTRHSENDYDGSASLSRLFQYRKNHLILLDLKLH